MGPVPSTQKSIIGTGPEWFTLVELIVVITILAILWTIAFISLQWYSANSRDSVRISDTSNMKTALELFHLDAGKYPLPDNYGTAQYIWDTLFYQGTFWTNVLQSVSRNMSEVPTDPLTEQEYIYSVSVNKNELEILSLMEWDDFALNTIQQTNAAWITVIPKISWTYNWLFVKTATNIIPLPSIINTEMNNNTILTLGTENIKSMVTNLWKNIPKQWNVISNTWALTNLVLTWALNNLTKKSTIAEKAAVVNIIKSAYATETQLNTSWVIKYITNLATDDTTLASVFDTVVLNGSTTVATTDTTPTITDWRSLDTNCDKPDVTIWLQTWAGCNSTLWTSIEYGKTDAWTNWTIWSCYKDYSWTNLTTDCVIDDITMASNTKANTWFTGTNVNSDSEVDNIWWKYYTWANSPSACATWYHVPTDLEWEYAEEYLFEADWWATNCRTWDLWECDWTGWKLHSSTNATNNLALELWLPLSGHRHTDGATFSIRGYDTSLWSSTEFDATNARGRNLIWNLSTVYRRYRDKSRGFSVRCIKD